MKWRSVGDVSRRRHVFSAKETTIVSEGREKTNKPDGELLVSFREVDYPGT